MENISQMSLLEVAIYLMEQKRTVQNIYSLIKEVLEMKGLDDEDSSLATQLYVDITTSSKFVYLGEDNWDLKIRQSLTEFEKDGSAFNPKSDNKKSLSNEEEDEEDSLDFDDNDEEEYKDNLDEDDEDSISDSDEDDEDDDYNDSEDSDDEYDEYDYDDLDSEDLDDDYDEDTYNKYMDDYEEMYED